MGCIGDLTQTMKKSNKAYLASQPSRRITEGKVLDMSIKEVFMSESDKIFNSGRIPQLKNQQDKKLADTLDRIEFRVGSKLREQLKEIGGNHEEAVESSLNSCFKLELGPILSKTLGTVARDIGVRNREGKYSQYLKEQRAIRKEMRRSMAEIEKTAEQELGYLR
uniref:Uncharacterized protein n=1 Tax=Strombidium inclinatum TaxID=197538 RepID=A0A7S3IQ53_9SPIT|mmetsp:Transcript_31195/g.47768  ORF Transcript_31195/g.47768 Transcript_31195/m.47768 type:complete len:165 (+) Transcript_31195:2581-3075(+)